MNPQICKICKGENKSNSWFIAKEMMLGYKDEFKYFECENCGCLQIAEIPFAISRFYPASYYSLAMYDGKRFSGFSGSIYKLRNIASFFRANLFHRILHFLSPVAKYDIFQGLGVTKTSRILDVGCGNGDFFIYPFKEMRFENVAGCDPYIQENISYSNGLNLYKTDIFGMRGLWDLIIYNHSFEHLSDPLENLEHVKKLLSPNGVCLIRMPTVPCLAWKKYGVNWFQLDAPRHFFIHSPSSLKVMCEKLNLAIKKIAYDSTDAQFTISENYEQQIPLVHQKKGKGLARKIRKLKLNRLAKKLNKENLGDQAAFILINRL